MEQYRKHRYQTYYPVVICTPQGKHQLHVIDVNEQGARLKGQLPVRVGENLTIPILYMKVRANVQWVGEGFIGVAFTPALSAGQLSTMRFGIQQHGNRRFDSSGLQELR